MHAIIKRMHFHINNIFFLTQFEKGKIYLCFCGRKHFAVFLSVFKCSLNFLSGGIVDVDWVGGMSREVGLVDAINRGRQ